MREFYELKFDYADPRLAQFDFKNDEHSYFGNEYLFKDFDNVNGGKLSWQPPVLSEVWEPQEVVHANGTVPAFCDYTTIGSIPVFSRRAVAVLRDLFEPCGELLPLKAPNGDYFAFNILSVSDAFDRENGDADFAPESSKETAFGIDRFEFHEDRLDDHAVFRIREYPPMKIVDNRLVERVEQAGLVGFWFNKIWPFLPGESWEDLARKRKREHKRAGKFSDLRSQGVEIRLPIRDEAQDGDEPTEKECEEAEAIVDQLTAAIAEQTKANEGQFIAAIEAIEPGPSGVIITLVCPDAKRTFEVIKPTLRASNWPFAIEVYVVPGDPHDRNVKSEIIRVES